MVYTIPQSPLRVRSKEIRKDFAAAFHNSSVCQGTRPDSQAYRALTNRVYEILFGGNADTLRRKFGVPDGESVRDYFPDSYLERLIEAEHHLAYWLNSGYPLERCLQALWQENRDRD